MTMEVIGFVFGTSAMSFAIIAWTQVVSLRKELEDLRKKLKDSGALE
ncbi:MAG: hypothetical protein OXG04_28745 [Acidobacteria bacterium]|nr:hypothetical protein [Acidobacteriota bacterium]